ncbi:hypothetical protein, partial [Actinomadura sp. KC345]|uniref:hypothetical protein n=1 Tax=Actinomadura sp. KC345 TaxID=2530371 RepID=UPI001A9CF8BC
DSAEQPSPLADGTDQPRPTDTQTKPGDEPTGQDTEATKPAPDTATRADEHGDQPGTENAPSSPEEPDRNQETRESLGQHDSDHGKKAEEPETTEPGDENNAPDRNSPQSGEAEEPGRELAPQETNTTEIEEPRRFHGRAKAFRDSDGKVVLADRDSGDFTLGRGELRRPEDDPADRDLREPGRNRWETYESGKTAFDALRNATKAMDDIVQKPNPTGHTESRPPIAIDNLQKHPNTPDLATSVFTLAVVVGYVAKQLGTAYRNRRTG